MYLLLITVHCYCWPWFSAGLQNLALLPVLEISRRCNYLDGHRCNYLDGHRCNYLDGHRCNYLDGHRCNYLDGHFPEFLLRTIFVSTKLNGLQGTGETSATYLLNLFICRSYSYIPFVTKNAYCTVYSVLYMQFQLLCKNGITDVIESTTTYPSTF